MILQFAVQKVFWVVATSSTHSVKMTAITYWLLQIKHDCPDITHHVARFWYPYADTTVTALIQCSMDNAAETTEWCGPGLIPPHKRRSGVKYLQVTGGAYVVGRLVLFAARGGLPCWLCPLAILCHVTTSMADVIWRQCAVEKTTHSHARNYTVLTQYISNYD